MQTQTRGPAVYQQKLVQAMIRILSEKKLSHEEVNNRIVERISSFPYPTLAEVFNDPSKLEFSYFAIFCTVIGLDYHEFANSYVKFSSDEKHDYWHWAVNS